MLEFVFRDGWMEFLLTETHKCYLIIQNIQEVPNGMWSNSP